MKLAMVSGEEEERATKKSVFHTYEREHVSLLTKFGVTYDIKKHETWSREQNLRQEFCDKKFDGET